VEESRRSGRSDTIGLYLEWRGSAWGMNPNTENGGDDHPMGHLSQTGRIDDLHIMREGDIHHTGEQRSIEPS